MDQDLRNSMFLAQYQTAREVVLHARQIQHSIVSWSSAAAGVLVGAGAVIARDGATAVTSGTSGLAFIVIFGAVLPGLAASSLNAWIGEIARMRRAAHFLRDIEFSAFTSMGTGSPPTPVYDTVVSRGPHGDDRTATSFGRQAVARLYFGLFAGSVLIAGIAMLRFDAPDDWRFAPLGGLLLLAGFLVWFVRSARKAFIRLKPYAGQDPTLLDETFLVELFGARE